MYELGYDMTRLGGIPKFYDRFGYVRGWSETSYFVKADELPARSGVRTKKFKVRHREDLARLYNRQYARTTGTAVRPTFLVHALAVHRWEGHMWTDPGGEPSGYVVVKKADDGDLLKCCEYVGDAETALGVIAKLARRRKCSGVEFNSIPYASELARRLRGGNCRAEVHYRRCAGSLIRTVNLRAAISKLCGEFSRRVKNSPFGSWRGNLLVCDAREEVTVAIDRGRVHVAPPKATKHTIRGGEEVAQLVLGTETPQETVRAAGMRLTGDAKYLVEVLFPDQHPTLSFADRF